MPHRPVVYHIPVCPFAQRLEILLALKGMEDAVETRVVDITKPRAPELLRKTRGSTALPVLELPDGRILKESLIILDYLDSTSSTERIRKDHPYQSAVERMLVAKEGPFTSAGYHFVMNQDRDARPGLREKLEGLYRDLNDFLLEHSEGATFLFEDFGLAEVVFTPLFMRFWFLEYYENFQLPKTSEYKRVRRWRDACLAHPASQQVSREEIVKLYYDYAAGAGNGALLPGRTISSFAFQPHWRERPWPPKDTYASQASDAELGLV